MENTTQISEHELVLIPIGQTIGDIRGEKKVKPETGGIDEVMVKLKGIALNLIDPKQVNADAVSSLDFYLEFILSVSPEPSWAFKEISIEGELDGMEGEQKFAESIEIKKIQPVESDVVRQSFHRSRIFYWELSPGSETGIRGENHFILWFTSTPHLDQVILKINLKAVLEVPDSNKLLRLALRPQDRKRLYTIPFHHQEK